MRSGLESTGNRCAAALFTAIVVDYFTGEIMNERSGYLLIEAVGLSSAALQQPRAVCGHR